MNSGWEGVQKGGGGGTSQLQPQLGTEHVRLLGCPVVDRAAATSRATREYSRLAADTTTQAAALAGSSMESGDVGLPLVAEQLRRRLATLQSTAQEEEFAALEVCSTSVLTSLMACRLLVQVPPTGRMCVRTISAPA